MGGMMKKQIPIRRENVSATIDGRREDVILTIRSSYTTTAPANGLVNVTTFVGVQDLRDLIGVLIEAEAVLDAEDALVAYADSELA